MDRRSSYNLFASGFPQEPINKRWVNEQNEENNEYHEYPLMLLFFVTWDHKDHDDGPI